MNLTRKRPRRFHRFYPAVVDDEPKKDVETCGACGIRLDKSIDSSMSHRDGVDGIWFYSEILEPVGPSVAYVRASLHLWSRIDSQDADSIFQHEWTCFYSNRYRDKNREWQRANPDKVKACKIKSQAKNKGKNRERRAESARNYRFNHPERAKESRRAYLAARPEYSKRAALKRKYGITVEEKAQLLAKQGGVCAICETDEPGTKGWCIDHCHTTNFIRGILCTRCNVGIGQMEDNIELLRAAISYLENAHQRQVAQSAHENSSEML